MGISEIPSLFSLLRLHQLDNRAAFRVKGGDCADLPHLKARQGSELNPPRIAGGMKLLCKYRRRVMLFFFFFVAPANTMRRLLPGSQTQGEVHLTDNPADFGCHYSARPTISSLLRCRKHNKHSGQLLGAAAGSIHRHLCPFPDAVVSRLQPDRENAEAM